MYYCQNTESFLFSFFYFLTIWLFDVRNIDWFIRIINQLGTKLHEARLLKTICLWNFKNIDRRNGNVPRSVEAIAGAVYGQQ